MNISHAVGMSQRSCIISYADGEHVLYAMSYFCTKKCYLNKQINFNNSLSSLKLGNGLRNGRMTCSAA